MDYKIYCNDDVGFGSGLALVPFLLYVYFIYPFPALFFVFFVFF